jgi:tRNA modification GTPase
MSRNRKTIFALSSGQGKAGVAVIRISGPLARDVLARTAGGLPRPRTASLRKIRHAVTRELLDNGLVIWFPSPNSFTGEDVVELHIHGGRAVIAVILEMLGSMDGLQIAEAGEFSRRAFDNGKLDLTEAEGLADLINAETEAQRRQALRQAGGALRQLYEDWRLQIIRAMAAIEAELDFSDEEDVPESMFAQSKSQVLRLSEEISAHLNDNRRGEILRDGFHVVISGLPNVGKSSLLNTFAKRDAAIVSDQPGTTRDKIDVYLDLGGYPVIITDTAGIREAASDVEQEGIKRAYREAIDADLVIWLVDCSNPQPRIPEKFSQCRVLRVWNKLDLALSNLADKTDDIAISIKTGEGISGLTDSITGIVSEQFPQSPGALITRARYRQHLQAAVVSLGDFLTGPSGDLEIRAEDLRRAAENIGRITGHIDPENVLDIIFSDFCIGK